MSKINKQEIITVAKSYIHTPYKHQGRTKGVALDCVGFLECLFNELGLQYNGASHYPRRAFDDLITEQIMNEPLLKLDNKITIPCILLMRVHRQPQHLSLCTGKTIIHASLEAGKVQEQTFSDYFKRRVLKIFRIDV